MRFSRLAWVVSQISRTNSFNASNLQHCYQKLDDSAISYKLHHAEAKKSNKQDTSLDLRDNSWSTAMRLVLMSAVAAVLVLLSGASGGGDACFALNSAGLKSRQLATNVTLGTSTARESDSAANGRVTYRLANSDSITTQVVVQTDKRAYRIGESITVTIQNGLPSPIYAAIDSAACSILRIEYAQDGGWNSEDNCMATDKFDAVSIPAGNRLRGLVDSGTRSYVIHGPSAESPTSPETFEGSLTDLPPAPAPQPGQPAIEVPQLTLPPGVEQAPLTRNRDTLPSGVYRLVLRFTIGDPTGPIITVHSEEFIIEG